MEKASTLKRSSIKRLFPRHKSINKASSTILPQAPPLPEEKSLEEEPMANKERYCALLNALPEVANIQAVREELKNLNLELALQNLEREKEIVQLYSQCDSIRADIAATKERHSELEVEAQKESVPVVDFLKRLEETAKSVDEESELLHQRLLSGEENLTTFCQKYKEKRILYHRLMLMQLAAANSIAQ